MCKNIELIEWKIMLFALFIIIGGISVNGVYAQSGNSSLGDRTPKHLPLKIKFEKAETEDLLASINVKITNIGVKPIYFLLLDIVPLDISDRSGTKFSFRLMYGDMKFYTPVEYAQPNDPSLLPGKSYVLKIDPTLLGSWSQRLIKDKKPKPKQFEFNFRFLSYGDGSGYWGKTGQTFSDRLKMGPNGELIKKNLMNINQVGENKIDVDKPKKPMSYLSAPIFIKNQTQIKNCQQKSAGLNSLFVNTAYSIETINNYNPLKSLSTAINPCNCPDNDCGYWKPQTIGCCPYDDPSGNTFIPYYEFAACNDYTGFCSKPEPYANPYYCSGGNPDYGCYGYYLDGCNPGPPPPPPGGGGGFGGGFGGFGGGCTDYYYVYYVSYDDGQTWEYEYAEFAGCW